MTKWNRYKWSIIKVLYYLKPVLQDLIGFALFGAHQLQVTAQISTDTVHPYSILPFTKPPIPFPTYYITTISRVSLSLHLRMQSTPRFFLLSPHSWLSLLLWEPLQYRSNRSGVQAASSSPDNPASADIPVILSLNGAIFSPLFFMLLVVKSRIKVDLRENKTK